jgi:hypothetical protein
MFFISIIINYFYLIIILKVYLIYYIYTMEVYNKLNDDMKDEVDKQFWLSVKQPISKKDFLHRKLRLLLNDRTGLTVSEKKTIDWLCWSVIRPRIHGQGYCGIVTESGHYEYKIDNSNKKPLYKNLEKWMKWLGKKNNILPDGEFAHDFQLLHEAIRLAVDDWCSQNIVTSAQMQTICIGLGYNIPEMYENYDEVYGMLNSTHASVFCLYTIEVISRLIIYSYGIGIDEGWLYDNFHDTDTDYSIDTDTENEEIGIIDINE